MESSTAWKPVGKGQTNPSPAYFYMIDNLLECRKESGFPSNRECYDEDVNVYLAGLLTSHIFSGNDSAAGSIIVPYDIPLFEAARDEIDPRRRFAIYRSNADDLLLRLGVYDNPAGRRPGSTPHMAMKRDTWIGRGKSYYRMAWASAAETFRRPTALGDIMEKLSNRFESYAGILSSMRSSCLNMIPHISDGEMFHLERSVLSEERKKKTSALYDRFLDAWNSYGRSGGPEERKKLEFISGELKKADPSFTFDLSTLDIR